MKFEDTIKKLSAIAAGFFIFFLAAGAYLSYKGFAFNNGSITLVKSANAAETAAKSIPSNVVIPGGRSLVSAKAPVVVYEYSSLLFLH